MGEFNLDPTFRNGILIGDTQPLVGKGFTCKPPETWTGIRPHGDGWFVETNQECTFRIPLSKQEEPLAKRIPKESSWRSERLNTLRYHYHFERRAVSEFSLKPKIQYLHGVHFEWNGFVNIKGVWKYVLVWDSHADGKLQHLKEGELFECGWPPTESDSVTVDDIVANDKTAVCGSLKENGWERCSKGYIASPESEVEVIQVVERAYQAALRTVGLELQKQRHE